MKVFILIFCISFLSVLDATLLKKNSKNDKKRASLMKNKNFQRLLKTVNKKDRRKLFEFFLTTSWTADELRWN